MVKRLSIRVPGPGLHDVTDEVRAVVRASGVREGLCTVFIRHTSASLTIQENADPSAARRLVAGRPRGAAGGDPLYTHTAEGPDDMPSHIKAALTATSLSIPVQHGAPVLGTWQAIYLFEHRTEPQTR